MSDFGQGRLMGLFLADSASAYALVCACTGEYTRHFYVARVVRSDAYKLSIVLMHIATVVLSKMATQCFLVYG
jgi:hypothetical protein